MKNTFKDKLESLGLSYSKWMIIIVFSNLILLAGSILGYLFLKNIIIMVVGLILSFITNCVILGYLSTLKDIQKKNRENEFITLLSYFEIYISNNMNIYNAFLSLIPFSSLWMKRNLDSLIQQIDSDKSIRPYIDFANQFDQKIIQTVMLSIYQMIEDGENVFQINQFTILFDNLNRERIKTMIQTKQRSFENCNIFPLLGAGFITLILTFSILVIVGGMVNG